MTAVAIVGLGDPESICGSPQWHGAGFVDAGHAGAGDEDYSAVLAEILRNA